MLNKKSLIVIGLIGMCYCLIGCSTYISDTAKEQEQLVVNEQPVVVDPSIKGKEEVGDKVTVNNISITDDEESFTYTNLYQGFTLQVPNEWKDKCNIVTMDKGSYFYYKDEVNFEEVFLFAIGASYEESEWDIIPNKEENESLSKEAGRFNGIIYTYTVIDDGSAYWQDDEKKINTFNNMSQQVDEIVATIEFKEPLLKQEQLVKLVTRDMNIIRQEMQMSLCGTWRIEEVISAGMDLSQDEFEEKYKEKSIEFGEMNITIDHIEQDVSYETSVTNMEYIEEYFNMKNPKELFNLKEDELLDIFEVTVMNEGQCVSKVYIIQDQVYIEIKSGSLFSLKKM